MYDIATPHKDLVKTVDLSFFRLDSPERGEKVRKRDNVEDMNENEEKEAKKLQLIKELEMIEEKIQIKKNQM